MRLLQVATDVCERLHDTAAALRYLREAQGLYETLVGRSSRAGFIATQVAHEYAVARDDRDRAREAQERAEVDRRRLATLNHALEERMRESQRLNEALQQKIAEAEALQEQLRDQAVRDPLTGLYNRRFLAETSVARIELARRQGTPIAIVLIDIDHFKQINDLHGHARGDEVLQQFAALLRDRMRRSDIICRFGGEEFVLLVDNCDDADARRDPRRPDAAVPRACASAAARRPARRLHVLGRRRAAGRRRRATSSRWCAWPTRACTARRPRAARGSASSRPEPRFQAAAKRVTRRGFRNTRAPGIRPRRSRVATKSWRVSSTSTKLPSSSRLNSMRVFGPTVSIWPTVTDQVSGAGRGDDVDLVRAHVVGLRAAA